MTSITAARMSKSPVNRIILGIPGFKNRLNVKYTENGKARHGVSE